MSIQVEGLTKIYGSQKAVDNISFTAKPGEILGFLGPNGAGKSTTMKIATCYIPPSSGTILVNGKSVLSDAKEIRQVIGYLPEHNPLYLDMYVHEYLQFVGSIYNLKGSFLKNRVAEIIEICGLTQEQNKKIGALSKGYRQRVGLGQALIHDPEILILDEPTTGLDPNQLVEIRNLIKSFSVNKTVILSTHIMQEVQALCDRVVIINNGIIVANDSVENLLNMEQGNATLHVSFDKKIDPSILEKIEGVISVQADNSNYHLSLTKGVDIRSEVFSLAKEKNWNLLELKLEESSLESVFQQLTNTK